MIKIENKKIVDIKRDYENLHKNMDLSTSTDIMTNHKDVIMSILTDSEIQNVSSMILNKNVKDKLNFEKLSYITSVFETVYDRLEEIRYTAEIESFLAKGYTIDREKIREKYNENIEIKEMYPNLDIDMLWFLYTNPPKKLKTWYSIQEIEVDPFVFRKFIIAIIQMIFNEMDLIILYTGSEGSGKSTLCSQHMYLVWYILKKVKIIEYGMNIENQWFNTLSKFREAEDKYFHDKFRIFGLDEGNELNRKNWREEEVETFFQRLRRERFNQRIKFICIPVLGELLPEVVLQRANFIFELELDNDIKTGTLKKGYANFYIIPRSDKVYSPKQKREISKEEVKNTLWDKLKDKSYLTGIPKSFLITRVRFNGIWGYRKTDYIRLLKVSNETFNVKKGISISETQAYLLYKSNITMKKLGIKNGDYRYSSIAGFLFKLRSYFEKDTDILLKYERIFERKLKAKEEEEFGDD